MSAGGTAAATPGAAGASAVKELVVPTNKSPWLDAYKKIAMQYEQQAGVRITLQDFPYDGLRTQMTNTIQSKNLTFDIFQLDEPWIGQFYDNGWVVPLRELDASFALDPQIYDYANLPRWDPAKHVSSPSGELMGLPLNGNVDLLYYRKDVYEELGLQIPKSWDDVFANGEKAKSSGRIQYGFVTRAQASLGGQAIAYEFMPFLYTYGGGWFAQDGSDWTPTVSNEHGVAAMEEFKKLLSLGPDQPQTIGQAEAIALMQAGQSLHCDVVAAAAAQFENGSASLVAGKVGYAAVPAGSSGTPAPTSGTWSLCVPTGLPKERAQAAFAFIRWMLMEPTQMAFTQAGGIPTRKDVTGSDQAPAAAKPYLKALADSMPNVRPAVRYSFATPMLEIVEPMLSQIAAGAVPVKDGLDQIAEGMARVVKNAGLTT